MDRELVTIGREHAEMIQNFIDHHHAKGLAIQAGANAVAANVHDKATAQEAVDWCASRTADKADVIRGPLGFWRNLFYKAHQATKDIERQLLAPYDASIAIVDRSVAAWRRQEEARHRQEEELARAAELKREEDRRLQAAQKLAERGQHEAAERVIERPMVIHAPVIPPQELDGVRVTRRMIASCQTPEDKWKFIKYVSDSGPSYAYLLDVNLRHVADLAKKQDATVSMPGITIEWAEGQSYGGRRRASA